VITITGIRDHLRPEWLITITGMRTAAAAIHHLSVQLGDLTRTHGDGQEAPKPAVRRTPT